MNDGLAQALGGEERRWIEKKGGGERRAGRAVERMGEGWRRTAEKRQRAPCRQHIRDEP